MIESRPYDLQSPYGCWLRFTEGVQTYNTLGDTMLETCAQQFYKHSSGRPLAAFLYAWTLTDQAIVDPTQAAREEKIRSALAVLHRSQSLNPDFTVLDIGEMRAHSIAGNRDAALRSARAALSEAQGNRVVTGMAATGLVLQGDNEGSAVLRRLENSGGPSPPWEQVGLFVAAMMADDSNEADRHMAELAKFESGQPLLLLLKAANARRAGRRDEADRALKELRSNLPIRIGGIEALLNRLPASAEVRQRLATWLKSDPDARNHRAIPVTQPKAPFP